MKLQTATLLAGVMVAAGLVLTPGAANAAGGCTTLYNGSGGGARVCKTWEKEAEGGDYYFGDYSVSARLPLTYVEISKDSRVSRAKDRDSYSHVKKFYMRACDLAGRGCGGWW